jgi:nucleoid-associated protein YgaU
MAHTYLLFDFGSDEEKAQQARHKLESWKQAFRLDKKLLYKLNRHEAESTSAEKPSEAAESEDSSTHKSAKSGAKGSQSAKPAAKGKSKAKEKSEEKETAHAAAASNGKVSLLVRLYFSGHEKLTEQRWLDRIPSEEPFKDASPRVVHQGEPQFDELVQQFEALE